MAEIGRAARVEGIPLLQISMYIILSNVPGTMRDVHLQQYIESHKHPIHGQAS